MSIAAAVLETKDAGGDGMGMDVSSGCELVYEGLDEADAETTTKMVDGDPVSVGVSVAMLLGRTVTMLGTEAVFSTSTVVEFGEESVAPAVADESGADTLD